MAGGFLGDGPGLEVAFRRSGQPVLGDLVSEGETIGQVISSSLFGKKAPPVFSSRGPEEGFGKHIILLLHLYLAQVTVFIWPQKFGNIRNPYQSRIAW